MSSLPRHQRLRRAVVISAFLGVAAVLLAVFARFESTRRATGREIARLMGPRDRLQALADRLESQGRQAESDRRIVLNVLRLCRSAEDIPDLRGNRVVAHHQGFEKLCLYVPEGTHWLEISSKWKATAKTDPSGQAIETDPAKAGEHTWSVPLLPACGYLLQLLSGRKGEPVRWELSSNHPDFPAQEDTVPLDGFSQRGSSWSGTDVVQFANEIDRFQVAELEAAATARPGVKLLTASLNGVCRDEPYQIAFNVRLLSDTPACVSASNSQRLIILRADHLLQPYAGQGKYEIRIPGSKD